MVVVWLCGICFAGCTFVEFACFLFEHASCYGFDSMLEFVVYLYELFACCFLGVCFGLFVVCLCVDCLRGFELLSLICGRVD